MKNTVITIVVALLFTTIFLLVWFGSASQKPTQTRRIQPNQEQVTSVQNQPPQTTSDEPLGHHLDVNEHGNLTVSPNTRQVFDYFIGTQNSPTDTNIARTHSYLHTHLNEQAALQADLILKDYAAYRKAADESQKLNAEIYSSRDHNLNAIVQMQQLTILKATYMSPDTIHNLYGDEDAIASYTLAKQQLMQMNGLTQEQKDDQLALLLQKLPLSAQKTIENSATATQ